MQLLTGRFEQLQFEQTYPRRLVSACSWHSPPAQLPPPALALALALPLMSMPPGLLVGSRLAALRAVPAATAS